MSADGTYMHAELRWRIAMLAILNSDELGHNWNFEGCSIRLGHEDPYNQVALVKILDLRNGWADIGAITLLAEELNVGK